MEVKTIEYNFEQGKSSQIKALNSKLSKESMKVIFLEGEATVCSEDTQQHGGKLNFNGKAEVYTDQNLPPCNQVDIRQLSTGHFRLDFVQNRRFIRFHSPEFQFFQVTGHTNKRVTRTLYFLCLSACFLIFPL